MTMGQPEQESAPAAFHKAGEHHPEEAEEEADEAIIILETEGETPAMTTGQPEPESAPAAFHKAGEHHPEDQAPQSSDVQDPERAPAAVHKAGEHYPDDLAPQPTSEVQDTPPEPTTEEEVPLAKAEQLRHTSRAEAGQHSNPHHLPRSVVQSELPAVTVRAPSIDLQVLADFSRSQLLLAQMLAGVQR